MKHVALAGATAGIGLALAQEYARRGWRVALLGRDRERLESAAASARAVSPGERVVCVWWDAQDPARARPALEEAAVALGQIDVLVYVAGQLLGGDDAEGRSRNATQMMEVNAVGAIRLIEHTAEYMVDAGRGRIAGIGSIAGDRGRKGNPAYAASKAALDTYLEGLRHRLHGTGVGVSTVKPGFVQTRMLTKETPAFPPAVSVHVAARRIVNKLERGRDVFYVPAWWAVIALGLKAMPRFLFKRIAPP